MPPRRKASKKKPAKKRAPLRRVAARAAPAQAGEYYQRLRAAYPDAHCALRHQNAYQLLVATILSAQCTDVRVNMVTPALFATYPDAAALAAADRGDLETLIKSTGFFRNKAKSLVGMARAVIERHGAVIPRTMEELTKLPGVGRKTANVVLGNAFGVNDGIVVDTHVARLSKRMGLTRETDPVKIERALMPLFPRTEWTMLSHLLIEHGRRVCDARKPECGECVLADLCPSAAV
jgi:endonuclease III